MSIIRYEPWSLLSQLQKELERSQENQNSESSVSTAEWAPAVDIKEETDKFVVHADIPGVKPEDIEVNMEAGVLTVKGEKKTEAKTEKEGYKRVELEAISAKCKHGVLEITIPKREAVKPKRIDVVSEE